MQYRAGESDGTYYRTDRFFQANGEWFFTTREGPNIGPYASRRASEEGLELFIRCIQSKDFQHNFDYAVKIARQSLWETTLLH